MHQLLLSSSTRLFDLHPQRLSTETHKKSPQGPIGGSVLPLPRRLTSIFRAQHRRRFQGFPAIPSLLLGQDLLHGSKQFKVHGVGKPIASIDRQTMLSFARASQGSYPNFKPGGNLTCPT